MGKKTRESDSSPTTVEAMAYVPFQPYQPEMCKPVLGYENGTLFRALNKPFYGSKCGGQKND